MGSKRAAVVRSEKVELPHPTEDVIIKTASVDTGIVTLVNWLNSHEGVFTLHSCQGGEYPAYCVFYCESLFSLASLAHELFGEAAVEVVPFNGVIRYRASFRATDGLARFTARLVAGKNAKPRR
jgi:hypothetical protein